MQKSPKYGTPTDDSPEWTKEDFKKAMRYPNFPPGIMAIIEHGKKKGRGPQKTPTKVPTTIRLSPDVLQDLRAKGPGWQTRANAMLRKQLDEEKEAVA